jgi:hypothetical protein
MKTKKICVFEDVKVEQALVKEVEQARENLQNLVDRFNELKMGNVQPNEIETLTRRPGDLFEKRTLSLEVPKSLSRQKYLQLYDLPSLSGVEAARTKALNNRFCMDFHLFRLEGATVGVDSEELQILLDGLKIFVEEGGIELEKVNEYMMLIGIINKLGKKFGQLLTPNKKINPLNEFVKITEVGGAGRYGAIATRENLLKYLKI